MSDATWWDDELPTAVDPWSDAEVTHAFAPVEPTLIDRVPQTQTAARRTMRRALYGAVYCAQTATDPDKYVGKSGPRTGRDGRKVQCSPGKRIDEHRDDQPWGREILLGRKGYRVLEWVEESGNGAAYDEANLRYREALCIQRINPTENRVRPVPVPPEVALQRRTARPAPAPTGRSVPAVRRPFAWFRVVSLLFWFVVFAGGLAFALAQSGAWWAPWLIAPALGLPLAEGTLWAIRRKWDRLTRPKARPPAKRRKGRRSRRW